MFLYGFDPMYFIIMAPGLVVALFAQFWLKSAYRRYSDEYSSNGITGALAAKQILETNGINHVKVKRVAGELTDHFNPQDNTVYLSENIYDSNSIAAIGVAAHEVGHALQYAQGYSPIKLRTSLVPICNIGTSAAPILFIIGYFLQMPVFFSLAIAVFALAFLFQVVTLPVEFNASKRAIGAIRNQNILDNDTDIRGARTVLTAAAMTYVAAMIQSLLLLLYYISRFSRNRN